MTIKSFGASTSGYLDPSNRNWETVVYEMGKPVLDKELNLAQDLDGGAGQLAVRRAMPSGWIADDFTSSSDPTGGIFISSASANTIQMPQGMVAQVNGWLLNIANTNLINVNQIVFPTPPVGAGVSRTDIVILEVWRRLISASPSTIGKSASARIWRYGNVKTDPGNDVTLNFVDDLQDANVGAESTKRVQIQYRLRVVSGIDIFSYPYGMNDPSLFANSVPTNAATPDGAATTFHYQNQSANGDSGLWIAGDNNPANALGTVDGLMYAIPLLAVFRRNQTAFNRLTNQNGGQLTPTASDRPDSLLADVLVARDIVDLRSGVTPTGWNYEELLNRNVTFLFDNTLRTEWTTAAFGGNTKGHTLLVGDEVGSAADAGGALIANFDASRRRFSDRSIYEVLTVAVPVPGGGWPNSTSTIDFTSLPVYPYTNFNWASFAPSTVVAYDIVGANFIGGSGKKTLNALNHILSASNLGAVPIGPLSLKMDALGGLGLTNETLYLDILIAYPTGSGLSKTPTSTYGASSFQVTTAIPVGAPASFSALANTSFDTPHRETQIEYTTSSIVVTQAADTTITNATSFRMLERCATVTAVQRNAAPITGTVTLDSTGKIMSFTNAGDYTSPGDTLQVTYTALRPVSPTGTPQITIWYEARAPQAGRDAVIGTGLTVIPRCIGSSLFSITQGSGSQDTGYPFPTAYVQTGGIYNTSIGSYSGEHELSSRATISISDFSASTGLLKLPTYIPFTPNPEQVIFTRAAATDVDIEGRSFFKSVSGSTYIPNAFAQDLSDPKKHKVVLPMLCELTNDSSFGFKGQLLLVLLVRWALFDETNGVFFNMDLTQNTTVASVFRVKGNLLNRRA